MAWSTQRHHRPRVTQFNDWQTIERRESLAHWELPSLQSDGQKATAGDRVQCAVFGSCRLPCPHVPLPRWCSPDGCVCQMVVAFVFIVIVTVGWARSLILERIWTPVRGSYARSADQVSVSLSSLADFICSSRIIYYIRALMVERNIHEVFIFSNRITRILETKGVYAISPPHRPDVPYNTQSDTTSMQWIRISRWATCCRQVNANDALDERMQGPSRGYMVNFTVR